MKNLTDTLVIPVDGTAGSGKSYLGMLFAKEKGFNFIDSGWVFRIATFAALEERIDLEDEKACADLLLKLNISCDGELPDYRVRVGGLNITRFISEVRVDQGVSLLAKHPAVRDAAKTQYKKIIGETPTVLVGRDIGTAIFPKAEVKFYIDADLDIRAERRHKQRGLSEEFEVIKNNIIKRDSIDSGRKADPLKKAEDAFEIINNGSVEEALNLMLEFYNSKSSN